VTKLVYCRGCGAQIDEALPTCTECGAPQAPCIERTTAVTDGAETDSVWQAILSMMLGAFMFLLCLATDAYSSDESIGMIGFCGAAIALGASSINTHSAGTRMAVAGIVLSVLALLHVVSH
jgi:hypothetical protein